MNIGFFVFNSQEEFEKKQQCLTKQSVLKKCTREIMKTLFLNLH